MKATQAKDDVIREFTPIGRYRVRLLKLKETSVLDIREYVSAESFEGFTRRGIRLTDRAQLDLLQDILKQPAVICIVIRDENEWLCCSVCDLIHLRTRCPVLVLALAPNCTGFQH